MKKAFLFTVCLLFVGVISGVLFNFQFARQQVSAQELKSENSILKEQSAGASVENRKRFEKINELIGKAQSADSLRVIVALRTDFVPEGDLSSVGKRHQRAKIRKVQGDLISGLRNYAVTDVKQFEFIPYIAFEADAAALEQMKNSAEIISIYEDSLFEPTLAESTTVIGAPAGISNNFSGSGQTVAVLDTGVDKNHIFFTNNNLSNSKVISEACYSTTDATEGSTSLCPNGASSSTAPDSGLNCPDSQPGCYHGTHVAGIVAGKDTAGNRFGVAKDANLISIQIYSLFSNPQYCVNPCVLSYTSDILRGLERVYSLSGSINIAAVNMSLGGGNYTENCDNDSDFAPLKSAIDNLRSAKIATVIASGNNYYTSALNAPGCISTAINVGSTTDGTSGGSVDAVSAFSNSADFLNLLAPGQTINSSMPGFNNFASLSGTSMATPHVAGAWAILKQQKPTATVSEILTALTSTGKIITDARNGASNRKTPRIRVDAASRQLAGTDCARAPVSVNQTVNASLDPGDCALEAGVNRDLFAFTATAGSKIAATLSSNEFNTYLYLLDPNGKIIAFDDDSAGGTNARIPASGSITLPVNGTYTIIATKSLNSFRSDAPQNGNYALNIFNPTPTAAAVTVSGSVLLPNGLGLNNALVTLSKSQGNSRTVLTSKGGRFRFTGVTAGETYIISVASRRYTFSPQIHTVTEDLTDLSFIALQ